MKKRNPTVTALVSGVIAVAIIFGILKLLGRAKPAPQIPTQPNVYYDLGEKMNSLRLYAPKPGEPMISPFTVRGEARGTWFFEASFPVELYDGEGKLLANAPAQAQEEWMTEDFVPFAVTLNFETPKTTNGRLVLRKDNPSGLPEHDDSISVPVRFVY